MHFNEILLAAAKEQTVAEILPGELPKLIILTLIAFVLAGVTLHLIYKFIIYKKKR